MKFNPISISWGVWLWLALVVVDQWPCFSYESLSFTVSFMSVSVLSVFCLRTDRRPVGPAQRFVSGAWAIPRKEQKKDVSAMSQGRAHCPQLILQNIARLPPAEKMNRWRFNSKSLVHSRSVGESTGRARHIAKLRSATSSATKCAKEQVKINGSRDNEVVLRTTSRALHSQGNLNCN